MTRKNDKDIISTPWDSKIFGIDTYEILTLSETVLDSISKTEGHFTVKVDPLGSKELLEKHGFYYCDTLIEPYCNKKDFKFFKDDRIMISRATDLEDILSISHGAFHGRFHRDFNIDKEKADLRYDSWLKELYDKGNVLAIAYDGKLAGFLGFAENRVVLNAMGREYRGRGLGKYFLSAACKELFDMGNEDVASSISISNKAAVNMYCSLGFKFRSISDVYHRLVKL